MKTFLLLLSLLAVSITHSTALEDTLVRLGTVEFKVDFNSTGNLDLYTFDKKEYVCFSNFDGSGEIVICTVNGDIINRVNLRPIHDLIGYKKFSGYRLLSLNRILLLERFKNQVYLIDTNAHLIIHKNYADLFEKNYRITSIAGFDGTNVQYALTYEDLKPGYDATVAELNEMAEKRSNAARIMLDSNIYDSTDNYSFHLQKFLGRFSSRNQLIVDGNRLIRLGDSYASFSAYSDTIYLYDQTYRFLRAVPVKSKYTNARLPVVTNSEFIEERDGYKEKLRSSGLIIRLYYDPKTEYTFCCVRHSYKKGEYIKWSMVIFDQAFNQIDEILFDHTKYVPFGYMSGKGLYLSNKPENDSKDNAYYSSSFVLFNYQKH